MNTAPDTIGPDGIRAGDRLVDRDGRTGWTATGDSTRGIYDITVEIEYPDGGLTLRAWDVAEPVRFHVAHVDGTRVLTLEDPS